VDGQQRVGQLGQHADRHRAPAKVRP
jgi:hypothetical protein